MATKKVETLSINSSPSIPLKVLTVDLFLIKHNSGPNLVSLCSLSPYSTAIAIPKTTSFVFYPMMVLPASSPINKHLMLNLLLISSLLKLIKPLIMSAMMRRAASSRAVSFCGKVGSRQRV